MSNVMLTELRDIDPFLSANTETVMYTTVRIYPITISERPNSPPMFLSGGLEVNL